MKNILVVIIMVGGISLLLAVASNAVDKPEDYSVIVRFVFFFVVLMVVFAAMSVGEVNKKR